ncbi:MAG: RebB family R body protein [Magnetovibrio sp.]|nr:RebB family R body protein [Magnetovibrio sp.]
MAKTTRSTTGRSKPATPPKVTPPAQSADSAAEEQESYELELLNELEAEANRLEAEAHAAAQTAAAAKAAYVTRKTATQAQARVLAQAQALAQAQVLAQAQALAQAQPKANVETAPADVPGLPGLGDDYLGTLSRVFDDMGGSEWDPNRLGDVANSVSMVLGSGPAFAALGSMLANSTAQSAVLMNATQMQRQLDHVGLCCTSACVKQLLSINQRHDSD